MDDELQTLKRAGLKEPRHAQVPEGIEQLWPTPPTEWKLRSGEVHVWSASLEQPQTRREELAATLSAAEKRKADQFRFNDIREKWVVGRGVLREILSWYSGQEASKICFAYGENGKPSLARQEPVLHFNFSHSGKLALCAICKEGPVGVDIENLCFMEEAESIAKTCFSRDEQIEFHCASVGEKQRVFYRIWTRKEAILKWSGRGISNMEESLSEGTRFTGFLQELAPAGGYLGCLALQKAPMGVRLWRWG